MPSYPSSKVVRLLDENDGRLTGRLRRGQFGWNPANLRNPIEGPADRLTWTRRPDGRVELDVERGHHRWGWENGVQRQHTVGTPPATPPTTRRRDRRIVLAVLSCYPLAALIGVAVALAAQAGWRGVVVGAVAGLVVGGAVLHASVLALGILLGHRKIRGSTPAQAAGTGARPSSSSDQRSTTVV